MSEIINPTGEQLYDATRFTHDSAGEIVNPATKEGQDAQNAALSVLAKEDTQLLIKAEIEALGAKDSATGAKQDEIKTALGALATEDKLELVRLLLASIEGKLGTVEVSNLPATQPVSGTVNVGNLPATQEVVGVVEISNLPVTQEVAGTVQVGNFPAVQPVSINNSITTLPVSISGNNAIFTDALMATTVAQPISDPLQIDEVVLQADEENSTFIYVGNAMKQTIKLSPGQSITIPVDDLSLLYAKVDTGTAQLNWLARGDA